MVSNPAEPPRMYPGAKRLLDAARTRRSEESLAAADRYAPLKATASSRTLPPPLHQRADLGQALVHPFRPLAAQVHDQTVHAQLAIGLHGVHRRRRWPA